MPRRAGSELSAIRNRSAADSIIRGFAKYSIQHGPSAGAAVTSFVKFLIDNWFLIVAAVVSGGLLVWPLISRGTGSGKVSPSEAVTLINREKAVLIDVSDATEYASGHAAGAKNVPLASLETSAVLPKNKSLPLVVLCATGMRSPKAVATLQKLGYANSKALAGGLSAWREANLPVEKAA